LSSRSSWQSSGVMETSQRKVARERSNDTLGELLQVTTYAKVDSAAQENAGMLSLQVENVGLSPEFRELIERDSEVIQTGAS